MKTLEEYRNDIDTIDNQIAILLSDRMDISLQIGQLKKTKGKVVKDLKRETEIKNRLTSKITTSSYHEGIRNVMDSIFEVSRAIQETMNTQGKYSLDGERFKMLNHANETFNIHSVENDKNEINAGYSGIPGAFAETALVHYFGEPSEPFRNFDSFSKVCEAVINEEISYGILPAENTTTGAIKEVYDLIRENDLYIIGEVCLPVVHNLIGLPESNLELLKEIYSHPQGLEQCSSYLSKHGSARLIPMKNTAFSIRYVAEQNNPTYAAIGDERAARLYGLKVLTPAIQDSAVNTTRFVILSKKLEVRRDADSTSIVIAAKHKVGSLHDILGCFSKEQINLFRIESRPIPGRSWAYYIYLDAEGSIENESVRRAIEAVRNQCHFSKFLGSYKKGAIA